MSNSTPEQTHHQEFNYLNFRTCGCIQFMTITIKAGMNDYINVLCGCEYVGIKRMVNKAMGERLSKEVSFVFFLHQPPFSLKAY